MIEIKKKMLQIKNEKDTEFIMIENKRKIIMNII